MFSSPATEWDRQLKFLLFAYRTTPHAVTGFLPADVLYGRHVKGPLDLIKLLGSQKRRCLFNSLPG